MSDRQRVADHAVSTRQRRAKRVTLGAVVAVVVGVVAYGIPANAAYALPDLPEKDVEAWTMPLDRYVPIGQSSSNYAELLVVQPCMLDAGYDEYVLPWRDVAAADRADELSMNGSLRLRAFDLATAETRGYHAASVVDPGAADWYEFAMQSWTAEKSDQLDTCVQRAHKTVPSLDDYYNRTQSLVRLNNAAFEGARHDPSVTATWADWRSCMQAARVGDVADDPSGMPTLDMVDRFETLDSSTPPSDDELEIATADARCRESSGYRDALYEAEWQRQLTVPHDDGELLAQIDTAALAADDAEVRRVLAELTPARPTS
ncbi:hypothetical protein ITJ55_13560 [Frigoribacterium sp. VKM Ac-1396]|uniref:hypothetical protein n=1 Tax=Frigoribacterium sp. VKM Ac-1396 TaxID=2783821 RepID=UPI00188B4183|nr:hypothetical protein [Frigoribacterium sp. VKM Ac-1396]MBF4601837.1 hypothetical protein [Frigoribacterium sp. VKM Ac-1396]